MELVGILELLGRWQPEVAVVGVIDAIVVVHVVVAEHPP